VLTAKPRTFSIAAFRSASNAGRRAPSNVNHRVTADQVLTTLIENVLEATALKSKASEAFEIVIGQFPNGLPSPNGSQRIRDASEQLSRARRGMMTTHNRLNDFLAQGIVPEDLRRSA